MDDLGVTYVEVIGEAAFYGPQNRYSIHNRSRERKNQCLQFNLTLLLKSVFRCLTKMKMEDENGEVFVIHREAPLSTHERFVAFLTEHWAGNFPIWLSPIQIQQLLPEKQRNIREMLKTLY